MNRRLCSVTIPRKSARAFDLSEGDVVKIIVPEGGLGGDFTFLGFDQSLTRNIAGWEKFGTYKLTFYAEPGMKLYDGDGAPHLEVIAVNSDLHIDIMYPGCWSELYDDGRPGCRDLMAQVLGIKRSEIKGMASYFTRCAVDEAGYVFDAVDANPGDHIVLKSLRRVKLGISACPDDTLAGTHAFGDLAVEIEPA